MPKSPEGDIYLIALHRSIYLLRHIYCLDAGEAKSHPATHILCNSYTRHEISEDFQNKTILAPREKKFGIL